MYHSSSSSFFSFAFSYCSLLLVCCSLCCFSCIPTTPCVSPLFATHLPSVTILTTISPFGIDGKTMILPLLPWEVSSFLLLPPPLTSMARGLQISCSLPIHIYWFLRYWKIWSSTDCKRVLSVILQMTYLDCSINIGPNTLQNF